MPGQESADYGVAQSCFDGLELIVKKWVGPNISIQLVNLYSADLKIKGVKIHTIYDNENSKVDPLRDIKAFAKALAKTRITYFKDQLILLRRKFIH